VRIVRLISYRYHTSTGSLWEGDVFFVYSYCKQEKPSICFRLDLFLLLHQGKRRKKEIFWNQLYIKLRLWEPITNYIYFFSSWKSDKRICNPERTKWSEGTVLRDRSITTHIHPLHNIQLKQTHRKKCQSGI